MAVTITGGKYAVASLNAVGTTTVTVSTTPFVSGDFAVPRRVDLYNSAGTTFKGTAFVRRYVSTSQLELETEFFDPKTGSTVTQVSGDTLFVSKNWADAATAGIAVANRVVTVSDTITFGTSGDIDSVCFHDEDQLIQNTVTTADARMYVCAGGFVSFGHLQSWATKAWYGGCQFVFNNTNFSSTFTASSTSARLCMFGGSMRATGSNPCYFGAGYQNTGGVLYGTDWAGLWALDTTFDSVDVMSKDGGGNWTTGANHILENCSYVGTGTNLILLRWANGSALGGQFKFPRYTSAPLSVFGGEAAQTYEVGAPADQRSVVLDIGDGQVLWRQGLDVVQTVNFTNVISTDYRAGKSAPPIDTANTTKNFYWLNTYSNLQDATKLATIRDSDWTTDDTDTSSGAASSVAMRVFYGTAAGFTVPTSRGPWTYRIRKYGYDEQEGAITVGSYALGTAGTANDIVFGGRVDQVARASLTDSEATALAYGGVTVTDHGASPVTWNSKSFSITIEVDLATYPTRTAAQVFAHVKAKIASLSTWGSKAGILWHVLMEESGSNYVSQRGVSGGAGATLKGVRIVDQAGNSLPGVVGHVADDGTTYVPPTTDTRGLEFTGLVAGSQVVVFETGTTTELFRDNNSSTTETWSESASGSRTVDYTISKAGYLFIRVTGVVVTGAVSGGVLSTPIAQTIDRSYVASSGLTYTTDTTANTGTKIFTLRIASTVQNWYSHMVETWIAQSAFANVAFPLSTNGPNSITLGLGWEWRGFTTAGTGISNTSLDLLSRDGMRYLDTGGTATAIWAALLSGGVPSGARVRFQQSDGGTTVSANVTSGNIDQLIQVYGDASHGNFDKRGYLVAKVQEMGYDQSEVDVVAQYGNLEDQLYVIALAPTANGVATGDPGITGVTITDHAGSPVTWNGGAMSITIDDSGANSGTDIMRWLRYSFETGGTFQSKDGFNWHDLVQTNGSKFKTVRGAVYGDTGATLKGVRVLRGTDPHPDFDLFTFDDGTTYAPPVTAAISITGLVNAGAVPTRLQVINQTAETATAWQATTAYSLGAMRRRTTGLGSENTAGLYFRATTAGTSGGTEPTWNTTVGGTTTDGTVTWTTYAVLFYDADPAATSYAATYTEGNQFKSGETVEVRFAEMNGATSFKRYHATTLASSSGFSFSATMEADDVFASNALDGSSYETTFSPNFTDDYIVMDTNTDFSGKAAYAYFCYTLTTSAGMYEFWDGVTALDAGNYRIETDILNLYFDESAGFVKQTDDVRIFRKDGTRPALDPTTGGNGIEINWRVPVSVVTTGGSALTPAESAHLLGLTNAPSASTVAAQVLTSAQSAPIYADIRKVNDLTVNGAGTEIDPWGP